MVIQRIQSLMLLMVCVSMLLVTFVFSAGEIVGLPGGATEGVTLDSFPPMLILNMLIAVLTFVGIFLYKNLRLQIKVTQISVVLTVASLGIYLWMFVLKTPVGVEPKPVVPCIAYVLALIFGIYAYRGEKHDLKVLTDSDRLR